MENSDKGDNSRKHEASDGDKPLKKARYLWEVKGKGHLKSSDGSTAEASTSAEISEEGASCSGTTSDTKTQNSHSCCLDTFLTTAGDILDRESSDDDEPDTFTLEDCLEPEIPVTLVSAEPRNQDYYMRKWQSRQIARGFVDNTINMMLETWADRSFDFANFVEEQDNDGQVEDDAILMAIRSHGLQSWGGSTSSILSNNSYPFSTMAQAGSSQSESSRAVSPIFPEPEAVPKAEEPENESSSSSTSPLSNPYEDGGDMDFLNAAVSVAIQKKGLTYG